MSKQDLTKDKFPRKFGKYHLLGPLAQGGMGALYLAVTGGRGLERLTARYSVRCLQACFPVGSCIDIEARFCQYELDHLQDGWTVIDD